MSGSLLASACSRRSRDKHEAADGQVVGPRQIAIGVNNEMSAQRDVDGGAARSFVCRATVERQRIDTDRSLRQPAWNPRIDDVDDAADRRRTEQEGRRAAQDLDPLGRDRVDGNFVVGPDRGHVERPDPVRQDADALALQPAQDRSGRLRAKAGRGNAREPGKRFADARLDRAGQLDLVDHRNAAEHIFGAVANAGDDDRLILVLMGLLRRGRAVWRWRFQRSGRRHRQLRREGVEGAGSRRPRQEGGCEAWRHNLVHTVAGHRPTCACVSAKSQGRNDPAEASGPPRRTAPAQ